jgi:predicted DNA-binding transcriptional regulator YafY
METKTTHQERHIRKRLNLLDSLLGSSSKRNYKRLLEDLNKSIIVNGDLPVSIRTLKNDIAFLVREELAPIHRPTKADPYIYYSEDFSIRKIPLKKDDVKTLKNALHILKGIKGFSVVKEAEAIINKLENQVTIEKDNRLIVHFDHHTINESSKHLDIILTAVRDKQPIQLLYYPLSSSSAAEIILHPYFIKEFRNRWYLLGRKHGEETERVFSIDGIRQIRNINIAYIENNIINLNTYFDNLLGVSFPRNAKPVEIEIQIKPDLVAYFTAKPIHTKQQVIRKTKDGGYVIRVCLIINKELRSLLLSYGPGLQVIKPLALRLQLKELLIESTSAYC